MGLHGISLEEVFIQTEQYLEEAEQYLEEAQNKDSTSLENSSSRKLFALSAYAGEASQLSEEVQSTFLKYANGITEICVYLEHPAMDKESGCYDNIARHFPQFKSPLKNLKR